MNQGVPRSLPQLYRRGIKRRKAIQLARFNIPSDDICCGGWLHRVLPPLSLLQALIRSMLGTRDCFCHAARVDVSLVMQHVLRHVSMESLNIQQF